ncbi:MAG: amylo-alpha-1,6-glucosidase [Candidatus Acidiferrum sp.]
MTDIVRVADEYYVRASSALVDDRTRVLKCGDTFAVLNRYGDIEDLGFSQFGLFHAESRHLSRFSLRLNQQQPLLLGSTVREDNAFLTVDVTNVDTALNTDDSLPRGTVHIFRSQFLGPATHYEHLRILNYGLEPVRLALLFQFDADFADIFEVRGTKRARKGERLADHVDGSAAILAYKGLDGVFRRTHLEFSPLPTSLTSREALFRIALEPKQETSIYSTVACQRNASTNGVVSFQTAYRSLTRESERARSEECHITTSSESFNAWLNRSSADLRMLIENNPEGPYPYAGVPWFSTVFGRDGIITALECLWTSPRMAESVLKYLAETQATQELPEQDAEPGKILHEMRRGEMAATKEVPFGRYYGSVDSTPLFVMLAGAYLQRTGNASLVKEIWPNVKRALQWIDTYGDSDGTGFVQYKQQSSKGLVQQGWKDSNDSVFHADGTLAEPPIALCEVQGYTYAAKRAGALLARALHEPEFADSLDAAAEKLRHRFEQAFWCEELGMYALALDGHQKQCQVRASNAGHALFCKIASRDHAKATAASLMSEHSFCGWGVRTVAACESRYNPMSYHNGSVWPHDNALIAAGFSSYGLQEHVAKIVEGMHDASHQVELHRLPELFCGFHKRPDTSGPTLYPVACSPQAWAAGSVYMLLQACLGLSVRGPERQICFTNPSLPSNLTEVRIENLRVGDATADFLIRRDAHAVKVEILRKAGNVEIVESV